jgi:hypothetical protein
VSIAKRITLQNTTPPVRKRGSSVASRIFVSDMLLYVLQSITQNIYLYQI